MTDVILNSSLPVVADSVSTAYGSTQLNAKIPKGVVFTPAHNLMCLPSYRGYMVLNDMVTVYVDDESAVSDIYTDTVIGSIQYPVEKYRYMRLSVHRKLLCINKLKKYLNEQKDRIWLLDERGCTLTVPQLPNGLHSVASYLRLPVQSESEMVLTVLIDDTPVTLFSGKTIATNGDKSYDEDQAARDYVESCQMDEGKEMCNED